MTLSGKHIGVALTGSFCTFGQVFPQIEKLVEEGAIVHTIFSNSAQTIDSRFGKAADFLKMAEEITGNPPIVTVSQAEPIGPKGYLDILIICPCSGNTLAKLANGITDSPVLMAAKAHLRNLKPLVISVSTNDALATNMRNIGQLLNAKQIYFVPFGQDNPNQKPNSMVADTNLVIPTLTLALEGKQIQPIIENPN